MHPMYFWLKFYRVFYLKRVMWTFKISISIVCPTSLYRGIIFYPPLPIACSWVLHSLSLGILWRIFRKLFSYRLNIFMNWILRSIVFEIKSYFLCFNYGKCLDKSERQHNLFVLMCAIIIKFQILRLLSNFFSLKHELR